MPDIQTIKLKKEKRFTRENDEDYDLLCKCWYTAFGGRRFDGNWTNFINIDSGIDGKDRQSYNEFFKFLVKIKFKQKGVDL